MTALFVALDVGSSLSKVLYSHPGQKPKLLLMEPEIEMDGNVLAEEHEDDKVTKADAGGEEKWQVL